MTNSSAPPCRQIASAKPPFDLAVMLGELSSWFRRLQRAAAAYGVLSGSYLSHTGGLADGERKQGLPLFEFPVAIIRSDGTKEVEKCVLDLKDVDAQYVGHILAPLINVQMAKLSEAAKAVHALSAEIVEFMTQAPAEQSRPK